MRAALLLPLALSSVEGLAGCASASPPTPLRSLVAHPVTFAAMPGPGPHRGYMLVGSAEASGLPEELRGRGGAAAFLPGRSRAKVVDGVLHFAAALLEKDFRGCVADDPRVAVAFSGGTTAAGRVALGPPLIGSLGDAYPVWK